MRARCMAIRLGVVLVAAVARGEGNYPGDYGLSADGRIDINLADAALLETLPGIGPAIAQRVIEYREMNGPFETIERLLEVQGIGPVKYDGIQDLVTVSESP